MKPFAACLALTAVLLLPIAARPADCPLVKLPPIALPHVLATLRAGKPLRIVALGSSSTVGYRASDEQHTYPWLLQADLSRALPSAHIDVLNRGISGQDAIEELARMDADVLQQHPTLVIWQVGANGAMRHTDPVEFQSEVDRGVREMEATGADVILMDNQRSPAVLASPEHTKLDQVLADIAVRDDARLFARGRLMELWQDDGHPYAEFLDGDGVHHNDHGYTCVTQALASAILDGLGPDTSRLHAAQ